MEVKLYQMTPTEDGVGIDHRSLPFEIKRVYYIYGVPTDIHRGRHAHKNTDELLICVKGSCTVLLDDGKEKETVRVEASSTNGLFLESLIWREMYDFSSDCILMVLASGPYEESDYLRNYDDYLMYLRDVKR